MPLLIVLLVSEWHVRVLLLWLAAEQFHVVNIDLGNIALGVVSGGVLASAQLALDVESGASLDISLNDLDDTAVGYDVVPLGALGNLCSVSLGVTLVGGGEGEGGKRLAVAVTDLRVFAHISQKNNFVYCHSNLL